MDSDLGNSAIGITAILCLVTTAEAMQGGGADYAYDDSSSEAQFGIPGGGDVCAIQRFHAIGGQDTITRLEIIFGSTAHEGPLPPPGTPVTLCVWEDPADSGDPLDAVLLATALGSLQNGNTDIYNSYDVPPVAVEGAFWVGYFLSQADNQYPLGVDGHNYVLDHVWLAGCQTQGCFNPQDLGDNQFPPIRIEDAWAPCVWLLRAHGMGSVGTPYCFGDGSGTSCPCGNSSGVGQGAGCINSSGAGASAFGYGGSSAGMDDLRIGAGNLLPSKPALLFAGEGFVNGGAGVPFGDGLRCAGTNVVRLGVRYPDQNGIATWGPGLGAQGGWGPGDVRYLQVWYRDPNPPSGSPCGTGFNLTNGLEVVLGP